MSDNIGLHWTEDDELLGQYILGRLSKDRQEELDDHLRSCALCRQAVQNERELASGIRLYGRKELKARLKRRITATPTVIHGLSTWQKVLSAAAVLAIMVGIGYYNRWFLGLEPTEMSVSETVSEAGKTGDTLGGKAVQSKTEGVSSAFRKSKPEEPSRNDVHKDVLDGRIRADEGTQRKDQVQINTGTEMNKGETAVAAPAEGGGLLTGKAIAKFYPQGVVQEPGERQFWTEGQVVEEVVSAEKKISKDANFAQEKRLMKMKSLDQVPQQKHVGNFAGRGEFVVSQRKADLLPTAKQRLQQEKPRVIQTFVEQSSGALNFILYLDTLFSEKDLRNATIERIGSDSVIIKIRSKHIAYKLPANILRRQEDTLQNRDN